METAAPRFTYPSMHLVSEQRHSHLQLPGNRLQLYWEDPEVFPGEGGNADHHDHHRFLSHNRAGKYPPPPPQTQSCSSLMSLSQLLHLLKEPEVLEALPQQERALSHPHTRRR